ncbi:MAG: Mobile element protein [uncultured Chloroflexia bacterium]|uniref:Mutator family transposase n=1 Tax=uncultured Chloroflexia bacterium TaxID=1672391 RepID=A0A6J4NBP9_9CHLR|nr:MAG: Mobile element protein [uncultured Chloroflexia bacterium]
MTNISDCTLPVDVFEHLIEGGFDALPDAIRVLINAAMLIERQKFIGVDPYQRTAERRAHANGFKEKTLQTRVGQLTVAVPQVREGGFYPHSLDKGVRSERALKLALAEMYVQGVSTRKVAAITEQLCGFEVSSSQVSRAAADLDAILAAWRERPLGTYRYVYLDARYEKVRQDGQVRDAAVLIATGVDGEGKRAVLGVSVALGEQEVHWRTFLQRLVERGMRGVELFISDAHAGLREARRAVFGGVPWQRCQFHLQQNAQAYVPRQEMKAEVAASIRAIFQASSLSEAKRLLAETVERYRRVAAKLATWMEENIPEGLMVFAFPQRHRRLVRTTNGLERLNQEIRRRTRVARLFPNEASCLRLVTAVVMEISDEWETGKAYLTYTE